MCEFNTYDFLAPYYDSLQSDIDPKTWAQYVNKLVEIHCDASGDGANSSKILCDLGCGNGRVDLVLASMGYDVIGIDSSVVMLDEARSATTTEDKLLWLNQDITDYELFGTADVFVSLLDTVNHITDDESLDKIFASFKNYMSFGGIFIFDIGTFKHFSQTLGDNVFFEDYDDFTLFWENSFSESNGINEASLTLFEQNEDETYVRTDGTITEKFYPIAFFEKLAQKHNLKVVGVYKDLSLEPADDSDERIFIVIKRDFQ